MVKARVVRITNVPKVKINIQRHISRPRRPYADGFHFSIFDEEE